MPEAYDWTTVDGHAVRYRTLEALDVCTAPLNFDIVVVKGHAPADQVSGDTHVGGGVVDIRTRDFTEAQKRQLLKYLRLHFAAWYRQPPLFAEHIHAVCIGDRNLSAGARQQVAWYWQGKNGLWPPNSGPDNWPSEDMASAWRARTTAYPQELELLELDDAERKMLTDVYTRLRAWESVPNENTDDPDDEVTFQNRARRNYARIAKLETNVELIMTHLGMEVPS